MIERIEINLLPAEYRVSRRSIKFERAIIYPVVVLVVLAIGVALYTVYLNDKKARISDDLAAIQQEIEANKHLQKELNDLRTAKRVTEEKIAALRQISVDREKWVRLLEMLSSNLPSYTWLVNVKEESSPPRLAIEARTYSFPEVATYMSRLEEHDLVSGVQLTGVEQIAGQGRMVYRFNMTCVLAAGAPPPAEEKSEDDSAARRGRNRRR